MKSTQNGSHYINGTWLPGKGAPFQSLDPASGLELWTGQSAISAEIELALTAARQAAPMWAATPYSTRQALIEKFALYLKNEQEKIAEIISSETGKPLWESNQEVAAMVSKVAISIDAYQERCKEIRVPQGSINGLTRHKPHGVLAVFGPFNFPGHLPNGHIIPALLAGNTLVFKPSELTPWVAEAIMSIWESIELPKGVLNMIQGGRSVGHTLSLHPQLDGLLFTGSASTGCALSQHYGQHPEKVLALEMGGNNPLVVQQVENIKAAAYLTVLSSFISAGQRCTCTRRLFVPQGSWGDAYLDSLLSMTRSLQVGAFNTLPTPFMGPLISPQAAQQVLANQDSLTKQGADNLLQAKTLEANSAFVTPGIVDITHVDAPPDIEIFGPLLQVVRYQNIAEAYQYANQTRFGLSAGLISASEEEFNRFYQEIRAGIVNWNTPTTGASSAMPFGGVGLSGNHRPSAYYAADYCAYPVASMQKTGVELPEKLLPGVTV